MKKIFSLFATASVALLGLTCCGGGGGGSSDAGNMSIRDFANGSKRFEFSFANSILLYLRPVSRAEQSGGEITDSTELVTMDCNYESGTAAKGSVRVTYQRMTEDGEYRLHSFSFLDDPDDLADPAVISSFGFTPTEIAEDLSTALGGIESLLVLTNMYYVMDMNIHSVQPYGEFAVKDANGQILKESGLIEGKSGTFIVNPN